jgi:hypothetical protein
VNESVARIEAIIGRKVKRDLDQMTEWAEGNLARAAEAIMNTPNAHVQISVQVCPLHRLVDQ